MRAFLLSLIFLSLATPAFSASELVMFNSPYCEWCQIWEKEIGVVYGKTDVGRTLPVRRVDIQETRPSHLTRLKGIRFTPTFVVLDNGREVGRITGYPGESFFWGLLEELAGKLKMPATACNDKKLITADATPHLIGTMTC